MRVEVCEDKSVFESSVYNGGLSPFSPPSFSLCTQKLAPNTHLCTAHNRKHVIPIFCVGGHIRKMLHARLPRSEEFSENVTVRSEISTWQVVLAVTFGILFEEKKNWIVNPILYYG